jgi:hypothetical protein
LLAQRADVELNVDRAHRLMLVWTPVWRDAIPPRLVRIRIVLSDTN